MIAVLPFDGPGLQLVAKCNAHGSVHCVQGQVAHQGNELIGMAFVGLLCAFWCLPDGNPCVVGIADLFAVGGCDGLLWCLRLGERVRRSIQPHQIAALLGVLHGQREGSPFVGQGFVHDLQEHVLMAPVLGHDFGCSGVAVFLCAIFQPLGQDAFGQALPQFVNLALQAMRPRLAVFARNAAVCLIETGDCPRPLLKQAVPQNRHVDGRGLPVRRASNRALHSA
ncbi:MAG: hypothetical protein LC129_13655 [Burkholderiales bacterium]|nr:hypothetical protein [Burkholderiales bacterium]